MNILHVVGARPNFMKAAPVLQALRAYPAIRQVLIDLQIPCLTMRANTERPITIEMGTNILVGSDTKRMEEEIEKTLGGHSRRGSIPPLWDGKAGQRVASVLAGELHVDGHEVR